MAAGSEEDLLQQLEDEDGLEYYTLLNLDRSATQEEVCVCVTTHAPNLHPVRTDASPCIGYPSR